MQSQFPRTNTQSPTSRFVEQSSALGSNMQARVQMFGQLSSQTLQELSPSVNNNTSEVVKVKVESEDTFSAPALEEKQQDLGSLNHPLVQDEQDLHSYSNKITEGENAGKFQCNLCGKISRDRTNSFQHVENIHFPGSYEYQCDQCDEKFDTNDKWRKHRSRAHSSKKSK